MKTPRGDDVTGWSMDDSDYCGGLKYDSLTIEAEDKMEVCFDYLLKSGHIKWQGSIRATYNKYIHPLVLDYTSPKMWEESYGGHILDLFQFMTKTGGECIRKIQPTNLIQMSNANSLMRIVTEVGIQPIDKYQLYKNDISLWYKEMADYGITSEEDIKTMEDHLLELSGVSSTQEDIMEMVQNPKIAGFTLAEADAMRKIVAKKKNKDVAKLKIQFYEYGKRQEANIGLLNYVWEQCIEPQLKYSFSRNHVMPYSAIALQEMNLYYHYPSVYWNCASIATNSGTLEVEEGDRTKSTKYGKISKAIGVAKNSGIIVSPPSINKSEFGFTPLEEDNSIKFGMGGISGINKEIADQIIANRPYSSFKQFYTTHKYQGSAITKSKFINLIKSGCFDEFNTNRVSLMKWLCFYENTPKTSLDGKNMASIAKLGVKLDKDLLKAYNYKQYVCSKQFFYCNDEKFKSKKHYIIEPKFALPYFTNNIMSELKENVDYYYDNDNLIVIDKALEKALKPQLTALSEQLKTKDVLDDFNKKMLQFEYSEMVDNDNVNQWSFDTVCFFHDKHILTDVDLSQYSITSFNNLPETPHFVEKSWGKKTWKQYDLSRIAGIVLDRDDTKHIVTILTDDDEVVGVKFYAGAYSHYKQTIAMEDDKDSNWFARGNLLMVSGFRSDDNNFVAKKYANSIFQHSVILIKQINKDGSLDVQLERFNKDSEEE